LLDLIDVTELAGSKESSRGGGEDGEHLNLVTVARCLNPTKCTKRIIKGYCVTKHTVSITTQTHRLNVGVSFI
jgi:hypothetical protein